MSSPTIPASFGHGRNFDAHGEATVFSLHNYYGSAFLRGLSGEDRDLYVHRELRIACA
jgi:hypothetical protein